ncbi:MAG: glycosyltransferase [Paludibacteraceae bacterium]|nr:glycosyltransferase [Paludibacteraceae bacterium]MBQ9705747.1 glycosyltransferase [Paludibacteraceae bacterium]
MKKVSIITVTYNSGRTLQRTLRSVQEQTYPEIEHIIVDGASSDSTLAIIKANESHIARYVSEPDRGIYDAINKGIRMATGDIIGLLNSDDVLASPETIAHVVKTMKTTHADALYADLQYCRIEESGSLEANRMHVVRHWQSEEFDRHKLRFGWMPPHPTLYCRRNFLKKVGEYRTDFRISADYEFMLRMLNREDARIVYMPEVTVNMSVGGISNRGLRNIMRKMHEDHRALRLNHMHRPYTVLCKNLRKCKQFFQRKKTEQHKD